jgi:hypothetical protein
MNKNSFPIDMVAITLWFLMLARIIHFFQSPLSTLIGVVPDDAFYYLQMALHRAVEGHWTFDGVAPATGFHLLYGYGLVALYTAFGKLDFSTIYLVVSLASSACIALAAWLTGRTVCLWYGRSIAIVAMAPFFTAAILVQATSMMESWLVTLLASLTLYLIASPKKRGYLWALSIFVIGLLGSLARSDFGMFAGCLSLATLFCWRSTWIETRWRILASLAGAGVGVLLVVWHTHWVSGHLAQASADMKLHWSALKGHSIWPVAMLFASGVLPFSTEVATTFRAWQSSGRIEATAWPMALLVLLASLLFLSIVQRGRQAKPKLNCPQASVFFAGALLTCVGYLAFYSHNSAALQTWYVANLIVPLSICFGLLFHALNMQRQQLVAWGLLAIYAASGVTQINKVTWPHQAGMLRAAMFVRDLPANTVTAGWNAGIVGYFSGGKHINIDGLANDDAAAYIVRGDLMGYLRDRHVTHIVDYGSMLDSPYLRARGGYADSRIDRCLTLMTVLDDGHPTYNDSRINSYSIRSGCL